MSDLSIIPKAAVADARLTCADVRVLCAIGIHTDKKGLGAWASARTLAGEAALTRTQFFLSAKKLLELGYVRRRARDGRTSVYAIVLDHRSIGKPRRKGQPVPESGTGTPVLQTGTPPVLQTGTPPVPVLGTQTSPLNDSTELNDDDHRSSSSLDVFSAEPHRQFYRAARDASSNPEAFDAMLRTVHEPPTGGTPYTWELIGQALLEIAATDGKPRATSIRAFCERLAEEARAARCATAPAPTDTGAWMPSDEELAAARSIPFPKPPRRRLSEVSPSDVVSESVRLFLAAGEVAA